MRAFHLFVLTAVAALICASAFAEDMTPPEQAPGDAKPAPGPGILTLRDAANQGLVDVEGFKPTSYTRVHLRIRNRGAGALRLDLCGSHMEPRTKGSCQRLGIGPVVTPRKMRRTQQPPRPKGEPPGTVLIDLGPNEVQTLEVNTCCLDSGTPAPRKHKFRVARKKLPPVRERVLRWWADHPEAPQYAVNTAIWKFRDEVIVRETRHRAPAIPPFTGVAGHAGLLYRLRSGELMSRDPDGIVRFLGTEIVQVFPTDSAVYAIALGPVTSEDGDRGHELWRLVATGQEPWRLVARIPEGMRLHDLQVAPSGAVLVTTNRGLCRVDAARKDLFLLLRTKEVGHISFRFNRKGRALMTLREPAKEGFYRGGQLEGQAMAVCELWELDPMTGKRERVQSFWNVREVKTGEAGTYALTPAGKLRRLVGRSLRTAPGHHAYQRILRVGRTCVWLESRKGRLVAVDKVGRPRFQAGPNLRLMTAWDMDTHDDSVVYLRGQQFYRLDPESGKAGLIEIE